MKFIFTTDGHLSSKKPIARMEKTNEEYIETQLEKREQMFKYAMSNDIKTIFDGGDFFQYWRMEDSSNLLIKTMQLFSKYPDIKYISNIGNHDIKYHSLENIESSLIGVLVEMGVISIKKDLIFNNITVHMFQYSENLKTDFTSNSKTKVAVVHENIFQSSVPPYMGGYTAKELTDMMPEFDLFLCGHNHEQFVWSNNRQLVVNGGSTMRLNTKQIDYKPAFWEVCIDDFMDNPTIRCNDISVKKIEYDIKPNMISTDHLKDKKIETFVESTRDFSEGEVFDFRKDVEDEMEARKVIDNVKNFVYDAMDKGE